MKNIIITSCISAGEIILGMERTTVRKILGNYSEYKNQPNDKNTVDYFDLCTVFYNESNSAEFIMFHTLEEVELIWGNKALTKMTKLELILFFSNLDNNLSFENGDYGIISIESSKLGIACYFETDICIDEYGNETEIDKIETISIAVKNYWK